jgi:hypothetical protein
MHAALVTLTIDRDQAPAAAEALVNDILPMVRSAPGFVAGYWLEPADGQGFSIVLFETEEDTPNGSAARQLGRPGRHHRRRRVPTRGRHRLGAFGSQSRRTRPVSDRRPRRPTAAHLDNPQAASPAWKKACRMSRARRSDDEHQASASARLAPVSISLSSISSNAGTHPCCSSVA